MLSVFRYYQSWFPKLSWIIPFSIAAIFAACILHVEVVANIKSRDEIMSLFFLLLSFLTWHTYINNKNFWWLLSTIVSYFFALMSKETGVTMFPIFGMVAYWVYQLEWKEAVKQGIFLTIPVILLFIIRFAMFGSQPTPEISIMDNPIVASENLGQHFATSLIILLKYLKLLFFPVPLSSDYSYTVIPLARFSDVLVWVSLIVHMLLIGYAIIKSRSRDFIALFIWGYLFSLTIFSQIPLTIGTMFGERLAFLASFWWSAALTYSFYRNILKSQPVLKNRHILILTSILCIGFATKTYLRNKAWKDNLTLFTTDVTTYPKSVRLNNGAAETVLQSADLPENASHKDHLMDEAEAYCNQILSIKPVPTAYLTLGNIRLRQNRFEEAIQYYDQVNDLKSMVDVNKAIALREMGRNAGQKENNIAKSQNLLQQSIQLNEKDAETWFLLGVSHGLSGNHAIAADHFSKAYNLNPLPAYAQNASTAYQNAGNQLKATEFQSLAK
ncbi:MAG: DUF1736 domain-containing protein [Saprospiraceae bacterium]